jgi:glycosyltransferase involved in cell wall biosynthesis
MKNIRSITETVRRSASVASENAEADPRVIRPFISIVVPAYNEAAIVQKNLTRLCEYLESLESEYRWEILFVNDGSTDETGALAEDFARTRENIHVLHHRINFGLGQAFKFAFNQCQGEYVITLDLDLSYSPDHIQRLLDRIRQTHAKIVVASPYVAGGEISNVPWFRRLLSVWANRFLSLASKGHLSTLTGMVRVHDARFLKSLNLKSTGMEINPETIYKASLLHARIDEIPAHLNWDAHRAEGVKGRSSMKVLRHTMSVLLSGFLFRPVMFFLLPGFAMLAFAVYVNGWVIRHFVTNYQTFTEYPWFLDRASMAVAAAYNQFPHTFIVGGLAMMLAVQLISLGILSLQSKSYFEEIFHLGTSIYRSIQENGNYRI